MPRISVIIPTYNRLGFLREAVESVLAQSFTDFELLVVDDGSTDGTFAYLESLQDPRVRPLLGEHRGVSVARNIGLDHACGEFIAFLDSDDRWDQESLGRRVEVMLNDPCVDLVANDFTRFDVRGTTPGSQFSLLGDPLIEASMRSGEAVRISGDVFENFIQLRELPTCAQNTMLRAGRTRQLRFPPGIKICEDLHYFLHVWAECREAVLLPDLLLEVRRHEGNSYNSMREIHDFHPEVVTMALTGPLGRTKRQALRRRLATALSAKGYFAFWSRDVVTAARSYLAALVLPGRRLTAIAHLLAVPLIPLLPRRSVDFAG